MKRNYTIGTKKCKNVCLRANPPLSSPSLLFFVVTVSFSSSVTTDFLYCSTSLLYSLLIVLLFSLIFFSFSLTLTFFLFIFSLSFYLSNHFYLPPTPTPPFLSLSLYPPTHVHINLPFILCLPH